MTVPSMDDPSTQTSDGTLPVPPETHNTVPTASLPSTPQLSQLQSSSTLTATPTPHSGHQDGINPETAALLAAAAAHGRQDAVQLPRDAKLVSLMLQGMGIADYEPRVIPQLLEFMHRYVLDILGDAQTYAEHANHNTITADDVRIAIEGRAAHSFTSPPRREFLEAVATKKNAVPLPLIPEKFGVRLPPERHTLTSTNFQISVKRANPPSSSRHPPSFVSSNSMAGVSHPTSPNGRHMGAPGTNSRASPQAPGRMGANTPTVAQAPSIYSAPPPMMPTMTAAKPSAGNDDDYDEEEGDDPMVQ